MLSWFIFPNFDKGAFSQNCWKRPWLTKILRNVLDLLSSFSSTSIYKTEWSSNCILNRPVFMFFQSPRGIKTVLARSVERQHICSDITGRQLNKKMAGPTSTESRIPRGPGPKEHSFTSTVNDWKIVDWDRKASTRTILQKWNFYNA